MAAIEDKTATRRDQRAPEVNRQLVSHCGRCARAGRRSLSRPVFTHLDECRRRVAPARHPRLGGGLLIGGPHRKTGAEPLRPGPSRCGCPSSRTPFPLRRPVPFGLPAWGVVAALAPGGTAQKACQREEASPGRAILLKRLHCIFRAGGGEAATGREERRDQHLISAHQPDEQAAGEGPQKRCSGTKHSAEGKRPGPMRSLEAGAEPAGSARSVVLGSPRGRAGTWGTGRAGFSIRCLPKPFSTRFPWTPF